MHAAPQTKQATAKSKPCSSRAAKAAAGSPRQVLIQPRLTVNRPGDRYEEEAERVADTVMRMPDILAREAVSGSDDRHVQRACAECEEELQRCCANDDLAELQAKSASPARAAHLVSGNNAALVLQAKRGPSHALPESVRRFMEPRFGHDFGAVRVHADATASASARAVGARAYTLGRHVVFAAGEFQPSTARGRRLLAHELTHVVQQRRGAEPMLRRTLTASSSCPAGVHGAPADPIAELTADDQRSQLMALGSSHVLGFEALLFDDPTFGRSYVSDAYERRFGLPPAAPRGRFRNRFTDRTYATQNEAMREEMLSLSTRYQQLNAFLSGPIRYRCPGTSSVTLPGCAAARCRTTSIAFSCPGGRQIAICPAFWTSPVMQTVDQRGGNMIHEAVHMRFRFRGHGLANANERGRNPECFAAFVADVYGFQSDDSTDCTPLIP